MATGSTSSFSTSYGPPVIPHLASVPILEPGDKLTRAEFERRYEAMTEINKAELIEGTVYLPSPVRFTQHGQPHTALMTWLGTYEAHTPGVEGGDNSTIKIDNDNMPQPDALLMISPNLGGQAQIDLQGYIEGPPELIAEIASSSASIDLNDKFRVYRRNGVREYIAWRVLDGAIDWFALRDSEYVSLVPDEKGLIRSVVFPGLWLNVPAMLAGRLDAVLATLHESLSTPEHRQFAARLSEGRRAD